LFFKQTYRLCDIRNTGILDLYQGTTKLIDGIPLETLLAPFSILVLKYLMAISIYV
jgi:hypothetical protein